MNIKLPECVDWLQEVVAGIEKEIAYRMGLGGRLWTDTDRMELTTEKFRARERLRDILVDMAVTIECCPECGGTGGDWPAGDSEGQPCPKCMGKGYINKESL